MIRHFYRNSHGVALIEFALVLPFLIMLFLGSFELARYIFIIQKVEKTAYGIGTIVSQYAPATNPSKPGQISTPALTNELLPLVPSMMAPYDDANITYVKVSSIMREKVGPNELLRFKWHVSSGPYRESYIQHGGFKNAPVTGAIEDAAQVMNIALNENILAIEVFYDYQPMMQPILTNMGIDIPPTRIRRAVYLHPRKGPMTCSPPNYSCP